MRAVRRSTLLALALQDRRFGYPLEMAVRAAEAAGGSRRDRVDYPRTGKSKVTGTVRGTARAVRDMRRVLASITTPAPDMAAKPAANAATFATQAIS